jgi:hypothetical protein
MMAKIRIGNVLRKCFDKNCAGKRILKITLKIV